MESALNEQPIGLVSGVGIQQRLSELFDESNKRCGLSWDYFVQLFSTSVDSHFANDIPEVRTAAVSMATALGYQTPEQIKALLQEMESDGYCTHGLDPKWCPAGCGDIEDEDHEPEGEHQLGVPAWIEQLEAEEALPDLHLDFDQGRDGVGLLRRFTSWLFAHLRVRRAASGSD